MNKPGRSDVVPVMRFFFLLLVVLVTGCLSPEEAPAEGDDMSARGVAIPGRALSTPEQWGQEKVIRPTQWKGPGQATSILTRDTPRVFTPPQTSSLLCGVVNEDTDDLQRYFLRWVLRPGVGGARTEVVFDATRFTRLSLPLEAFSLSLRYDPYTADADAPEANVNAFAFVGEGGLSTDEASGPTYTAYFVTVAGLANVEIPAGATSVRMAGGLPGVVGSPFHAQVTLVASNANSTLQSLPGLGAAPADPSCWTLFASGGWLRIPGSANRMAIVNGSGVARDGFLIFKLDL